MEPRLLAAAGLAAAGLSQASAGLLLDEASLFPLFSLAEGAGLLLAAAALLRAERIPGPWLAAGLGLAALASLPWFTRFAGFGGLGPFASLAGNTGAVLAGAAALAWFAGKASAEVGWGALRLGLALGALGALLWLVNDAGDAAWLAADALAVLGFAGAAWALPMPEDAAPAGAARAATAAAGKAP